MKILSVTLSEVECWFLGFQNNLFTKSATVWFLTEEIVGSNTTILFLELYYSVSEFSE